MTPKHLFILLLAIVAAATVAGQNEEIPVENDNQFPPDNPSESIGAGEAIEGSGGGEIEDPIITNDESTPTPELEEVQKVLSEVVSAEPAEGEVICPKPCVCHTEGDSDNFVVDCSGYDLTEFPSPLASRTTTLNVRNNRLTEIPKDVASLTNLKVLNAENNLIMDLVPGSISNLAELTVLKLGNNRLIEFPNDLKNGFGLTNLKELDLGHNDMRTELKAETFSIFQSLSTLTIATSTPTLVEDLCGSLKETLQNVCTGSCSEQSFECLEAPDIEEDDFIPTLPGMIVYEPTGKENADPVVEPAKNDGNPNLGTENPLQEHAPNSDLMLNNIEATAETPTDNGPPGNEAVSRSRSNKDTEETVATKHNSIVVEVPKEESGKTESDVKIGATTTGTTTGGVDKSVIGIIVAGMVVVVAGIVIKRNWSSIRKRFSSSPRPPIERGGANANGTTPEEVPLQDKQDKDKSPV